MECLIVFRLSQEIELTEEELRVELDRYRRGLGENIVASTSSTANTKTEDKELQDVTNTLTIESVPSGRSARTRGANEVNVRSSSCTFLSSCLIRPLIVSSV